MSVGNCTTILDGTSPVIELLHDVTESMFKKSNLFPQC